MRRVEPLTCSQPLEERAHVPAYAKDQARGAQLRGDRVLAMCLAQEFSVDAQLALAHTRALKAEESLRQVNSGTVTLQSESERERPQPVEVIPRSGAAVSTPAAYSRVGVSLPVSAARRPR
jgi:hypothetical protein